jgi:inorganic pyrophosphatase
MRIDAIAIGENPPEDVNVIIEVPIGGEPIKYEMDKEAGTLIVDRFLYTPMRYPGNYGFVPHTLSEDGDPIDVLVANTRPIVPGAVINVRPIGVLRMQDEHYKDLEPGKWVKTLGWGNADEAKSLIRDAIARAKGEPAK